jgi:hypothetical protein
MCAGACGTVAREPPVDGAVGDRPSGETPTMYTGTTAQTSAIGFGGTPYCKYTITLKMLDIELGILPSSKQVITGHVQDLNVEAVVPTTPPCAFGPADPSIANYNFTAATQTSKGMMLTFQGAAANAPAATLMINLMPAGTMYSAALSFHRTDEPPPLDWSVAVTLPLSAH